jgi:uncharacterized membrane protein YraQ (UPF0718 family)
MYNGAIMTSEKSYKNWYFLLFMIIIYLFTFFINPIIITSSLEFSLNIFKNIIPIFFLIIGLMFLVNYYVKTEKLEKYMGKGSGIKGWIISIISGIISTGPIYMWYPLLNDLQKKGVRNAFIAIFLYNRGIKIPILPLLVYYFGAIYSAVLIIVMIGISVIDGFLVEKLMEVKK